MDFRANLNARLLHFVFTLRERKLQHPHPSHTHSIGYMPMSISASIFLHGCQKSLQCIPYFQATNLPYDPLHDLVSEARKDGKSAKLLMLTRPTPEPF